MTKKRSLYIGPELNDYIHHHSKKIGSVSGCVNVLADRYQEIVKRCTPKLTLGEWCLIFDSLNGYMSSQSSSIAIQGIEWNIRDSIAMEKLDKKWKVNGDELMKKIVNFDAAKRVAIIDAAEKWWGAVDGTHTDMDESIKQVVGKHNVIDKG